MKKAFIIALLVGAVFLTGCEHYPRVLVDTGTFEHVIEIDIGSQYQYEGFDAENIDEGKDLILHFNEGNEYDE